MSVPRVPRGSGSRDRHSTPLPRRPSTEADFRSAAEAMQRAAEAMFAATASFRQVAAASSRPPSPSGDGRTDFARHSAGDPRRGRASVRHTVWTSDGADSIRRSTGDPPRGARHRASSNHHTPSLSSSSSAAAAVAAAAAAVSVSVSDIPDPARNPYAVYCAARAQSGLSSPALSPSSPSDALPPAAAETAVPTGPLAAYDQRPYDKPRRPSTAGTDSPPLPPPPPPQPLLSQGGHRPSVSSYIDLLEAAARLKRPPAAYQGTAVAQAPPSPWPAQTRPTTTPRLGPPRARNGPPGFSLAHETAFVLVVCLAQMLMLAGLAQALVPAALIGASFGEGGGSAADRTWYTAAYGLTAGTCVLPAGRLGDVAGHRRVFVAGFVWFAAWSLAAGCAGFVRGGGGGGGGGGGTTLFVVARALQGIGPALLVPNGQAMLGRAYAPGPRKNLVLSLFGASAPAGFVAGAVLASLLAARAWWPWAFWTMAAVCTVLAGVSQVVMPADADGRAAVGSADGAGEAGEAGEAEGDREGDDDIPEDLRKRRAARAPAAAATAAAAASSLWVRMDGAGMVLGVAGLVLVNVAFNQAPLVGWATPYTYFLLVLGVLLLAAFAYVEAVLAACPLVPRGVFRSRAAGPGPGPGSGGGAANAFVLGCTGAGWGCFAVWVAYAVQMFEALRGWSALRTAAAFAPAPVAGLAASLLTGRLLSRGVAPHAVMLASMLAFFGGSLLFATAAPRTRYWLSPFFSIALMPFGMDMSNPAATILLSNGVARAHQGAAASLVVTVVNYAISLALGIAGSVEAAAVARAARGGGGGGGSGGDDSIGPVADDDPHMRLAGYRAAQYFGLGLGGLGVLLAAAFLFQSRLRRRRGH